MEKTLLIVDDETNIGSSLKRSLSLAGYKVFTATSGEEGLAILERNAIPVVMSDQLMPHMTGAEFLTKVKALYPNTIRIIFTAYAEFNTLSDAFNNGNIHKILSKPWEEEYLVKHISSAFDLYEKGAKDNPLSIDTTTAEILTNTALHLQSENVSFQEKSAEPKKTPMVPQSDAQIAIMITDAEFKIQSVNATFCHCTGYNSASIIGKKIALIDPNQDPKIIRDMENGLKHKSSWQGFIQLCKESGETFSTLLSIASIIDMKQIIKQYTYTFAVSPVNETAQSTPQGNSPPPQ